MEYGINILGLIPLRAEPKDQSEMISQVLFGQHFQIIEVNAKWIKIKLAHDNYEGWICSKQYQEITFEDYDNLSLNEFPLVSNRFTHLQLIGSNDTTPVSMGAILPYFHKGITRIRNNKYHFNGNIASKHHNDILKYAYQLINTPYLWGGKSIFGIDCSGFTQLVYNLSGITIPRDAYQQAELGVTVEIENIKPSDLVFFINANNRIHHVGISLDNNQIIHASGKVRIDSLTNEGIIHSQSKELTHRLHLVKRLIE